MQRRRVVERSEKSRRHKLDVFEILPPFGRLNDTIMVTSSILKTEVYYRW